MVEKYKAFLTNQKSRQSYRSYYQEYCRNYNKKNKEKILNYQRNKTSYDKLMKGNGSLIEYIDTETTIRWD